jgi:hypothetical protein
MRRSQVRPLSDKRGQASRAHWHAIRLMPGRSAVPRVAIAERARIDGNLYKKTLNMRAKWH